MLDLLKLIRILTKLLQVSLTNLTHIEHLVLETDHTDIFSTVINDHVHDTGISRRDLFTIIIIELIAALSHPFPVSGINFKKTRFICRDDKPKNLNIFIRL